MYKKKRTVLTIKEKASLIDMLKTPGITQKDVAIKFNVTEGTISKIKHAEKLIMEVLNKNPKSKSKTLSVGKYQIIEEILIRFMTVLRNFNLPVTTELLKEKALEIASKLNIKNFQASSGWFSNFKERNLLQFKNIGGSENLISVKSIDDWRNTDLEMILKSYSPDSIFNADETGLFYELLPDHSILFPNDKGKFFRDSKSRLTLLLCSNMSGTSKIKPLVIGRFAKPRCFKGVKMLPINYKSNSSSWMTSYIFNEWLLELEATQKFKKQKILLLLDNAPCHRIGGDVKLEFVKIYFLPPNTTSVLQPLDQGIIKSFKGYYKKNLLRLIISKCESNVDNFEKNFSLKINMLEAITIIHSAWNSVTDITIMNCFKHAFNLQGKIDVPIEDISEDVTRLNSILRTENEYNQICTIDDEFVLENPDINAIIDDFINVNTEEEDKSIILSPGLTKPTISEVDNAIVVLRKLFYTTEYINTEFFNYIDCMDKFWINEKGKRLIQSTLPLNK